MHLYGGKHFGCHPVYQWNSVDVLTDNGFFQHGEVINVADNGLIVDFHCSEQRAEFVSYDKIFDASQAPYSRPYRHWQEELRKNPAVTEHASVQVLCRAHPDAPWIWYPGLLLSKALFFHYDGIALLVVLVEVEGWSDAELFPADQVRFPPSPKDLDKRALTRAMKDGAGASNAFVVRQCRLPKDYAATVTPAIAKRFRRRIELVQPPTHRLHVVSILKKKGVFTFLQRFLGLPPLEENVETEYEAIVAQETSQVDGPGTSSGTKKRKNRDDDAQSEGECVLPTQPYLLREIFDSLDSVSRLKLRRVCSLWNAVLTDPNCAKTVRISFDMNPFFPQEDEQLTRLYGAVGGLLKCINPATERLILEHVFAEHLENTLPIIGWMLRHAHIKQLILHKGDVNWDDVSILEGAGGDEIVGDILGVGRTIIRRLAAAFRGLAPLCDELLLLRYEFNCSQRMETAIPLARMQLNAADIEAQFWELYEAHLSRDGVNLEETVEWIRTGPKALRRVVAEELENWQSYDPRPTTTHYRDREWTVEDLKDLDLSKLTTITLCALKAIDSEDWDYPSAEEENGVAEEEGE
ncbi:uncharacterized protein LOC129595470 [Paramacrobiotus metropolitanus]|uniref:uncharacterized protein LOC129595470 n=1 Tax=Paramacrobiotus metropolitanus TaxID=2943436 RepID=UPI002445BFD9|nr:uncharacterized protein LOC129595470 [Paramacrobiotus metropolitanus]